MKKVMILIASLLLTIASEAQTINVHKTDGTVDSYPSVEVEYIDFTPKEDPAPDPGLDPQSGSAPAGAMAVDLGLPSGTKWANMNVGAEKPEDYGLFFAWGETVGYSSDASDGRHFDLDSYKWGNGRTIPYTKYCIVSSNGIVDNKVVLDLEDDAAHVNWAGNWRMPTTEECIELFSYTTHTWTSVNGINGCLLTSKSNGNTIFLPAAGKRIDLSTESPKVSSQGDVGVYWSSSLYQTTTHSHSAYDVQFQSYRAYSQYRAGRAEGLSVRPVIGN